MSDRPVVLLISHNEGDACGVYQMGRRIWQIMESSPRYDVRHVRVSGPFEVQKAGMETGAKLIVVNYYPSTMPWAGSREYWDALPVPVIGIAHEVTHADARIPTDPFPLLIVCDPSFPDSPYYEKSVRPLPVTRATGVQGSEIKECNALVVSTFGYALPGKGFENVVRAARREATPEQPILVRVHAPLAHFNAGGAFGDEARKLHFHGLRKIAGANPSVWLELSTEHWDDEHLLGWLAQSDVNALLYEPLLHRGISAALDWCVAAGKPILISNSDQFRHVRLFRWPQRTLREASGNYQGTESLQYFWQPSTFRSEWEAIFDRVLERHPKGISSHAAKG